MIIDAHQLNKHFGNVHVLKDLDLQVPEGAAFALLGTNGAGKTTTIRTLMNIIKPDCGYARVMGKESTALYNDDYRKIGYVSENQGIPGRLTITQYFDYLRALYPNWDRILEKSLRKQLDLPSTRQLNKLSHGMRMKTVLVGALSFRPKLLILDEPLSGLDSLVRDEVVEGLLRQADESTILISSHEVSEIENFITHIAFMNNGRLLFQESIESIRARFREVTVRLADKKVLPTPCPNSWLAANISGHLLQLVDTAYIDDEKLYGELREHFGAVEFDAEPMSLREITKTLIRAGRDGVLP